MTETETVSVFMTRVSVTMAQLGPQGPEGPRWLSEQERARYMATTAIRRSAQFLAGRWWARQCLAAVSGGTWHRHLLSAPDDAAPQVLAWPDDRPTRHPLHFSLSHSADWLACAVASHPIGIDVEDTTRPRDTDALGEWVYGPHERVLMAATPLALRRGRFFDLWCLKEAWIKQRRAPGTASMSSVQFKPCTGRAERHGDDVGHAVVLNAPAWTMALLPARPSALRLHGTELTGVPMSSWRMEDDERIRA